MRYIPGAAENRHKERSTLIRQQILDLYDQKMRREAVPGPGLRVDTSPTIVRHVGVDERQSFVLYSAFRDGEAAEEEIAAQAEYFRALGHTVEWKTYSHDSPTDLVAKLERAGFVPEEEETLVAFDLETGALPGMPRDVVVHRLSDPAEIAEVERVQHATWGEGHLPWLAGWLREEMALRPESLSVFGASASGITEAQSVGWITYAGGSRSQGCGVDRPHPPTGAAGYTGRWSQPGSQRHEPVRACASSR